MAKRTRCIEITMHVGEQLVVTFAGGSKVYEAPVVFVEYSTWKRRRQIELAYDPPVGNEGPAFSIVNAGDSDM